MKGSTFELRRLDETYKWFRPTLRDQSIKLFEKCWHVHNYPISDEIYAVRIDEDCRKGKKARY